MMTITRLQIAVAFLTAGALFTACKKDYTASTAGYPNAQLTFSLKSDNSISSLAVVPGNVALNGTSSSSASITFTSGIANISSFKLEAKKNGTEKEITTQSLLNVDLFAITPASAAALIDTGTYKKIEVKVTLAKSNTTVLPLVLKGNFISAGGAVVPVELDYNDDVVIKAETAGSIVIDGANSLTNNLSLHLNKLLTGISSADVDAAIRTGGTIVINSSVNAGIYNKIKSNVLTALGNNGFEKHDR